MTTIDALVREVDRTLSPRFGELQRAALADKDRECTADEIVGTGIVRALSLINNLEVNEQILCAHMIDVVQTTRIS